ncbi:MAG: sodium:solute symporter [Bacteroidetes bacterium]|nr:sodium:solute symporter [Bacteroidota bacterium]
MIDWAIVLVLLLLMIGMVLFSKSLVRSVTDFLATGRTGGRYIISMFHGTAALGAITVVGALEQNYNAGFNSRWWEMPTAVILVAISVSGWVIYRFRQTRSLTMAQFFEQRYSRSFRLFAGFLAFFSGLFNMVIFPSVTARFFIYFCGIPEIGFIGSYSITFILTTAAMVLIPLYFIFTGGHIAVMFTDFIQGVFVNIVFVIIVVLLLMKIDWIHISTALLSAAPDHSLVNPFDASKVQDFNPWFFFIGMFGIVYTKLSWQGNSSFNIAAKSAHEARMADVLTNWRLVPQWGLFLVFVPIVAYTVFHHGDFKGIADSINATLSSVGSPSEQSQLRVPMVLNYLLPVGLKGAFVAIMLAASITCHNTYMHSWGSILIQDCIMPLRKKAFEPKEHLKYLKLSILGVGITIFILSILFQQTEKVFLFLNISGAIFVGGSGAVIIGGLYWKRGTTPAAWAAMITGATAASLNLILNQIIPNFPINGQWGWFIAMISATFVYVIVSLLTPKPKINFDQLLHRGAYEVKNDHKVIDDQPLKGWKVLGTTKEFTKGDKFIYVITMGWTFLWVLVFVVGTIYYLLVDKISNNQWVSFWKTYTYIFLIASIIVTIWFTIGGIKNLKEMIHALRFMVRDHNDSGFVDKKKKVNNNNLN